MRKNLGKVVLLSTALSLAGAGIAGASNIPTKLFDFEYNGKTHSYYTNNTVARLKENGEVDKYLGHPVYFIEDKQGNWYWDRHDKGTPGTVDYGIDEPMSPKFNDLFKAKKRAYEETQKKTNQTAEKTAIQAILELPTTEITQRKVNTLQEDAQKEKEDAKTKRLSDVDTTSKKGGYATISTGARLSTDATRPGIGGSMGAGYNFGDNFGFSVGGNFMVYGDKTTETLNQTIGRTTFEGIKKEIGAVSIGPSLELQIWKVILGGGANYNVFTLEGTENLKDIQNHTSSQSRQRWSWNSFGGLSIPLGDRLDIQTKVGYDSERGAFVELGGKFKEKK